MAKGLPCSEPLRSDNSKREGSPGAIEHPVWAPHPPQRDPSLDQTVGGRLEAAKKGISVPQNTKHDESSSSGAIGQPVTVKTPVAATTEQSSATDAGSSSKSRGNSLKSSASSQSGASKRRRTVETEEGGAGADEHTRILFACPFYKFDPIKYFRCFRKYELRRYSDVRQHILRNHTLGDMYCANCWATFSKEKFAEFETHTSAMDCQRQLRPETLFPREAAALTRLEFGRGDDDESKWYSTWELLFPEHPRPDSTHVKPDASELLTLLNPSRTALLQSLPAILLSTGGVLSPANTEFITRSIHDIYASNLQSTTTRHRLQSQIHEFQTNRAPLAGNSHGDGEPNGPDYTSDCSEQLLVPSWLDETRNQTSPAPIWGNSHGEGEPNELEQTADALELFISAGMKHPGKSTSHI